MKIQFFSDQLRESLENKLAHLDTDYSDLVKLGQQVNLIRDSIHELKKFTTSYNFTDTVEEINFFKTLKPWFVSTYLFYRKLFSLAVFDSFRDQSSRLVNYQSLLGKLERYTLKNQQYYEYWITESNDLDLQYFLRGKLTHRIIDADDQFTTGYDVKFAKIIANDRFRQHLTGLTSNGNRDFVTNVKWSASKASLIELVYALHAAQAFNSGKADIKEIAVAVEKCFNISLGNYYRYFQDIRARKVNATVFLDELRQALRQHIESANE